MFKDIAEVVSLVEGTTEGPAGVRRLARTEEGFVVASPGRAPTGAPEVMKALESASARWGDLPPVEGGVAASYRDGVRVSWRGRELQARPAFGGDPPGQLRGGAAVFEGIDEGIDSVVLALHDRMEEFLVLERGAHGKTAFDYVVELPAWVERIRQTDGGWVEFWDDQAACIRANAPEAMDERGKVYRGKACVNGTSKAGRAVPGGTEWPATGQAIRVSFEVDLSGATGKVVFDPAWSATGSLATGRYAHTSTLLPNGKVLVAAGFAGVPALSSCELYDPATGTWSATGSMATLRHTHTATLLPSGKVLVAGGLANGVYISSCELYDPAAGTWSTTGPLATARCSHSATLLPNGKVLVTAGVSGGPSQSSCEVYDPAAGTWSATGSLSTVRGAHTATLLPNGRVLVAGASMAPSGTSCELYDPDTGTWSATGSMAAARVNHFAMLLPNGRVLAGGGGAFGPFLSSCEVYDPAAGTWSATGSLTTGRAYLPATLLPNGRVLAPAGFNAAPLSSCEVYDPVAGTWSTTVSMVAARYYHTATLLPTGKVLVAGGDDNVDILSNCDLYDPAAGAWSATGPLAAVRGAHSATLLPNGNVLAAGGTANNTRLSSCERYDPVAGTWSATASLATARSGHTATLLPSGKVLVAGGGDSPAYFSSCEVYDPETGTWSVTGSLAIAHAGHSATLLPDGRVLVAGGSNGAPVSSCEVYDPAAGTWSATGSMGTARFGHAATLLPSGRVLVTAGSNTSSLSSCEVYNPATGTWSSTGSMATARYGHTTTLLPSNKLITAGGMNNGLWLSSCEAYDPAAGTWSGTGSMGTAREQHSATLLPNGKVLAAAGTPGPGVLSSCEVYDPATGMWSATGSLTSARSAHTATLLPSGEVIVVGGYSAPPSPTGCEAYEDTGASDAWRPSITSIAGSAVYPVAVNFATAVTLTGTRFKGISEASGGCSYQNSSSNYPMVRILGLTSGNYGMGDCSVSRYFIGSATGWGDGTSLTVTMPAAANNPTSFHLLYVITNGIVSEGRVIQFDSAPPSLPGALTPVDASTVDTATPTLTWSASTDDTGIQNYDVQVASDAAFTSIQFSATVVATSATTSALLDGLYYWRVRSRDRAGNLSAWSATRSFTVDATKGFYVGLGVGGDGRIAPFQKASAGYAARPLYQLPWSANGETRPAAGNFHGDGRAELVVGFGRFPGATGGYLALLSDSGSGFSVQRWIRIPWTSYNAANGESWPACGDIDGDGSDEIVVGLGTYTPAGGYFCVFEDASANYAPILWGRVSWSVYNSMDGQTRPAVGDLDGDGASEVLIGLGSYPGQGGYLQRFTDQTVAPVTPNGWLRLSWVAYNAANGETWPACGDVDGDGRAEVCIGLGAYPAAGGYVQYRDDAAAGFAPIAWKRLPWTPYNAASGETRPSLGRMAAAPGAQTVIGLGRNAGADGWAAIYDRAPGFGVLGWRQVSDGAYNSSNGETRPSVGR